MWKKVGDWKFYCKCDWEVLVKEGTKDPTADNPVNTWYNFMKERFTDKVDMWPEVGCGARFVPWARGASQ
eukprot:6115737-Prorocentrum_lima.AAC.1